MKKGATKHSKIYDLAEKLNINKAWATGLMEELWHWTALEIPDGGVGKRSEETIAKRMEWPTKRAHELIEALLEVGLLDKMASCTYYVHDWHDHCEDSVHMKLAREGQLFANGRPPKLSRLSEAERTKIIEKFPIYEQFSALDVRTESAQKAQKSATKRTESALPIPIPIPMPLPMPKSSPYPLTETGNEEKKKEEEPPAQVKLWRQMFDVLKQSPAMSLLTYEQVVIAARAFPDVDLLAEAKKMASKTLMFTDSLDRPGAYLWTWLSKVLPEKKALPRERPFDPKKDLEAPEAP